MTDSTIAQVVPPLTPATSSNIGFLSIVHDQAGILGGYLTTNTWGRPLEFRWSSAVSPNRVQQILYGPTLTEYVHADLIGKALVEKTATPVAIIVTDDPTTLILRSRLGIPTIGFISETGGALPPEVISLSHPRCSLPLFFSAKFPEEADEIKQRLDRIDECVDLVEPFSRIREAIGEARRLGGNTRAA